jgi:hypothetical protein
MNYNTTEMLQQAALNPNAGASRAAEVDRLLRLSTEREDRQPREAAKTPGILAGAAALASTLTSFEGLRQALHHAA